MKSACCALALIGLFLTPSFGHAGQNGTAPKRPGFEQMDTDKDGFLSKEEYLAAHPRSAEKFAAMDADHDGKLSREEIKAFRAERRAARQANGTAKRPARHEGVVKQPK